jgi:hypothetical protein
VNFSDLVEISVLVKAYLEPLTKRPDISIEYHEPDPESLNPSIVANLESERVVAMFGVWESSTCDSGAIVDGEWLFNFAIVFEESSELIPHLERLVQVFNS